MQPHFFVPWLEPVSTKRDMIGAEQESTDAGTPLACLSSRAQTCHIHQYMIIIVQSI